MMQVRFQLEQTREGLQRQLAATDGQMHVLQARLEDSQAEQQVCTSPVNPSSAAVLLNLMSCCPFRLTCLCQNQLHMSGPQAVDFALWSCSFLI